MSNEWRRVPASERPRLPYKTELWERDTDYGPEYATTCKRLSAPRPPQNALGAASMTAAIGDARLCYTPRPEREATGYESRFRPAAPAAAPALPVRRERVAARTRPRTPAEPRYRAALPVAAPTLPVRRARAATAYESPGRPALPVAAPALPASAGAGGDGTARPYTAAERQAFAGVTVNEKGRIIR